MVVGKITDFRDASQRLRRSCRIEGNVSKIQTLVVRQLSSRLLVDQLFEYMERLCADNGNSIDEEGRRRAYAQIHSKFAVCLNDILVLMIGNTALKRNYVQVKLLGVLEVDFATQGFAVEELVVKLPVGILIACTKGGFRCRKSIRMD